MYHRVNYVTSLAGTFDRRCTGDTHDPAGLRETAEGVAAGDQAAGEMPRRSQAGSGERREKDREKQDTAGIAVRAAARAAEEVATAQGIRGRRGESKPRQETDQSEIA